MGGSMARNHAAMIGGVPAQAIARDLVAQAHDAGAPTL